MKRSRVSMTRGVLLFLLLIVAVAGCPGMGLGDTVTDDGGVADAGQSDLDGGPCGEPLGYAAGPECREPLSRVTSVACAAGVEVVCTSADNVGPGECTVDADCPGGSCIDSPDGCFCGARTCTNDSDCSPGSACACAGLPGVQRNACIEAKCLTNADCDGRECILSGGSEDCCDTGDARGLFCASVDDECRTNADCANGEGCQVSVDGSRFQCGRPRCLCD